MKSKGITDDQFRDAWAKWGSPLLVSKAIGLSIRNVQARRAKLGLKTWNDISDRRVVFKDDEGRVDLTINNGIVIVFSDAHFLLNVRTTAFRGLLAMIKHLNPVAIVCNGDAFDGSSISRFPSMQWMEHKASVADELKATQDSLSEIETIAGTAKLIWPAGNHDLRLESSLAKAVPEFRNVKGFHLKDWFPLWKPCWALWINNHTVIKHRWKNGIHASHNNTVSGGVNFVTGHLHQLKVTPFSDYNGRRYGVDTGTLADPYGAQFIDYTEAGPVNWHSGFVVLTFKNGRLLSPELVEKHDEDHIQFRGHVLHADTLEIQ